ncbi:hypothetical protein SDC9_118695 [bioreactor metagenome]|uniref:Uncharacterized protein n=1 Tax=bioreactor metagenome TaxID=1076179 RepID=A0A645C2G5_9ZZZZ
MLIFRRVAHPAQFFCVFVPVVKQVDEVKPQLFHPLGRKAGIAIGRPIALVERADVGAYFLPIGGRAAPELAGQSRVRNDPPAYHHRVHSGKAPGKFRHILLRHQIAVIGHRQAAGGKRVGKRVQMHLSPVKLPTQAGMDDQLLNGIAVENLQKPSKFRRVVVADAGLHRNQQTDALKYLRKKRVQLLRAEEKARTLSLCRHGAGRTAKVQIHLVKAQLPRLLRSPEKVPCPFRHNLGHGGNARVILRSEVPQFLCGQLPFRRGGEKGRKVPVHPAEHLPMGFAEQPCGDSLQRRGLNAQHLYHRCSLQLSSSASRANIRTRFRASGGSSGFSPVFSV